MARSCPSEFQVFADVVSDRTEFKIAPEYRRSVFYAMAGAAVLATTAWWVEATYHLHGGSHLASAVFVVLGVALCLPLTFKLQFEGDGLIRRRFGFSDEWAWTEFSSGRLQKRFPYTFVDPGRPLWCRRLSLSYLSAADRKTITARINEHYRLPAAPPAVDELIVRYSPRKTAKLDPRTIELTERGQSSTYRWSDVRHMQIVRTDPLRRDFQKLNLVLPDREIAMLINQKEVPSWSGRTAEALGEFLLAHLPPDVVSIDLYGERPHHPDDIQRDVNRQRSNMRQFGICMLVFAAAFVGVLLMMSITGGWRGSVFCAAMVVLCALPNIFIWKELAGELAKLEHWLSEAKRVRKC